MRAVETLGYRVTVGDIASRTGLDINQAERGLLALASDAGGHMQVAESGEIAYLFSPNFRNVLRSKYWRLKWQERWQKIWAVLFYLIRISFGIVLILSIVLILVTIAIIFIYLSSQRDDRNDRGGSFGGPGFWIGPDWFWILTPDYYRDSRRRNRLSSGQQQMNFLEAVFSFLFGDGNPNAELEEQRWQTIAAVIRRQGGVVTAEQIVPYLDELGSPSSQEYEDYMLPVLTRFNGRPEVSPEGQLIYHFPELQVTASKQSSQRSRPPYLKESLWRFSNASSGQLVLAASLGGVNLVGALVLGNLLRNGVIANQIGGLVAFTAGIYGILLAYGIGFLAIPLVRYFWIQGRNQKIAARNQQRESRVALLTQSNTAFQQKLQYARQFAARRVVDEKDLAYTTETDLTEQEALNPDKVDAEWRRRLEQSK
jgi:flagellar basal body-associated protein FliL